MQEEGGNIRYASIRELDISNGNGIGLGEVNSYYIVYANDTKVKYFVKWTGYQFGITPLYNADGTLQIYEESEDCGQKLDWSE